ncbi:MAG: hypothetical protein LBK53_00785 [Heliobacteriaceae bacterium]|jgi:hypothetical protein|nr:hypothetical protein [Heliobacteriaceae bacterium]
MRKTRLKGSAAGVKFNLIQKHSLFRADKIYGVIDGKIVSMIFDKENRFEGTIGSETVNMVFSVKGTTAFLTGTFESRPVNIKVKRGWLSTSIKDKNINLVSKSGTLSWDESNEFEGTFEANKDLIPFLMCIIQSITDEENSGYMAA